MSDDDETHGVPEGDGDSEAERPIESGRSATEEEREDPTRAPRTYQTNGEVSAENESE